MSEICKIRKYMSRQHIGNRRKVKATKKYRCQLCGLILRKGSYYYETDLNTFSHCHIKCTDGDKYSIPLHHHLACVPCGDSILPCPVCGRGNCHEEHILNFGKCGKCRMKELKIKIKR